MKKPDYSKPNSSYSIKEAKYHNPDYLIVSTPIDADSFITCCKPVNGGDYKMEYYRGENHIVSSKLKSYSRIYSEDQIPLKYKDIYKRLREFTDEWDSADQYDGLND